LTINEDVKKERKKLNNNIIMIIIIIILIFGQNNNNKMYIYIIHTERSQYRYYYSGNEMNAGRPYKDKNKSKQAQWRKIC